MTSGSLDHLSRSPVRMSFRRSFLSGLWRITNSTIFRLPMPIMNFVRVGLLRSFGASIGKEVFVESSVRVDSPWNLEIADEVKIEKCVVLNAIGGISFGRKCQVSPYAHFCSANHDYTDHSMQVLACPIVIGDNCWIAVDSFVGPNTRIGAGSLLASRSTAFGDLPGDSLLVGEPAKRIRSSAGLFEGGDSNSVS